MSAQAIAPNSAHLTLPSTLLARARQSAADVRAVEAAAGLPMLTVQRRYEAAMAAISELEARNA